MPSIRRHKPKGLNFMLLIVFEFALLNNSSSSEEECVNINGQNVCYFKAWDFGVDWDTAWQLCNSRNATLPAIRNQNEQDVFEKFLNLHMSDSVSWTSGRIHKYDHWTWLDGRQVSGDDDVYLWHKYDTNDSSFIGDHHPIWLETLRDPYHYICQYSGALCWYSNDTIQITRGCIRFSVDKRSWYDARNECLRTGGDLAILEFLDLYGGRCLFAHDDHWIGYRQVSWRWNLNKNASEEDDAKYTNWSVDWDPLKTGDCISINASDGKWKAIGCSEKLNVVCQRVQPVVSAKTVNESYNSTTSSPQVPITSSYISIVIVVAIFLLLVSNVIVAVSVRSYMIKKAKSSSNTGTQSNVGYQIFRTTPSQSNSNLTEIQLLPEHD